MNRYEIDRMADDEAATIRCRPSADGWDRADRARRRHRLLVRIALAVWGIVAAWIWWQIFNE